MSSIMLDLVEGIFQKGVDFQKSGKVEIAWQLYSAVLKTRPEHPAANHNMGVLAVKVGKVQEALLFFEAALEANPAPPQFFLSYIDALIKLEKLTDAKAVLVQAKSKGAKGDGFDKLETRLNGAYEEPLEASKIVSEPTPKKPNILDSLKLDQAISLAKKKAKDGSLEDSKRIYLNILAKFPKNKRARDGLKGLSSGVVGKASKVEYALKTELQSLMALYDSGQLALVVEQAQILTKQYAEAYAVWNLMGISAAQIGDLDQAVLAFKRVLAIKPDYAEAYNNMGNALKQQGKLEEAIEAYNKALAIKPDYAEAYHNMGIVLKEQGEREEAIEAYSKALTIKPDYAEAYNHMGIVLKEQGKLEEAIEAYNKALSIKPDYAEAYNSMSFTKLLTSSWREGIELRKWRWHTQKHQKYVRHFSSREWDGKEPINNKTLLIWAEQGPGDVVIWASCIDYYTKICRKIIIECHPKLAALFRTSFPQVSIRSYENRSEVSSEDFDFHVPMETLFGYTCLANESMTSQPQYLFPDASRVKYWRDRLGQIASSKTVGISWKSPVMTPQRANNYPEISYWGKTLQEFDFTFVNLQSSDFKDDISHLHGQFGCKILHMNDLDLYDNLSDVAALSQALDCTISVATAAATISAAVGTYTIIPTWAQSSWNNILFTSRGPNVDILQKNTSESWGPVFEKIKTKLSALDANV